LFEWVIIGGGIHGCTIANFLLAKGKTTTDKLKIIDPHPEPLTMWKRKTELIGMEFLRSPSVHHIDTDPFSLQKYTGKDTDDRRFYGSYKRPSLDLFNEHANNTLKRAKIYRSWNQGKVNHVSKVEEGWRVHTIDGNIVFTENIVVAISINNQPKIPNWVAVLKSEEEANIYHVYDEKLSSLEKLSFPVTVIGGGITAAHVAIKLSTLYPGKVTLLKRHPFRIQSFDSNPGWLGPKNLASFHKVKDYGKRRSLIDEARHKGSIPRELYLKLIRLEKEKKLSIRDGEVKSGETAGEKNIVLHLNDGPTIQASSVLLATGFIPSLPNEEWLNNLIISEKLQCAKCGYPIVQSTLEWCNHLYVSGPLSELEIGPVARNISGARKAAERIVLSAT